jgi:hypothetical protein
MIWTLSEKGNFNVALRFSEFEGIDTISNMAGRAKWVWVDCFSEMPLTRLSAEKIRTLGYKICIVSPELQGQPEKIDEYAKLLSSYSFEPDAVCCKIYNVDKWKAIYG